MDIRASVPPAPTWAEYQLTCSFGGLGGSVIAPDSLTVVTTISPHYELLLKNGDPAPSW